MDIKKNKLRRKIIKKTYIEKLLQNLKGRKKNFNFIEEWEKLGKKVSEKWDSVSLDDELKYQRNKTDKEVLSKL